MEVCSFLACIHAPTRSEIMLRPAPILASCLSIPVQDLCKMTTVIYGPPVLEICTPSGIYLADPEYLHGCNY